jgi:hypothetical protein
MWDRATVYARIRFLREGRRAFDLRNLFPQGIDRPTNQATIHPGRLAKFSQEAKGQKPMKRFFFWTLVIGCAVLWAYIALTEPVTQESPRRLTEQERQQSMTPHKTKGGRNDK